MTSSSFMCGYCHTQFATESIAQRHVSEVHLSQSSGSSFPRIPPEPNRDFAPSFGPAQYQSFSFNDSYTCPYQGCIRSRPGEEFFREQNLQSHIQREHSPVHQDPATAPITLSERSSPDQSAKPKLSPLQEGLRVAEKDVRGVFQFRQDFEKHKQLFIDASSNAPINSPFLDDNGANSAQNPTIDDYLEKESEKIPPEGLFSAHLLDGLNEWLETSSPQRDALDELGKSDGIKTLPSLKINIPAASITGFRAVGHLESTLVNLAHESQFNELSNSLGTRYQISDIRRQETQKNKRPNRNLDEFRTFKFGRNLPFSEHERKLKFLKLQERLESGESKLSEFEGSRRALLSRYEEFRLEGAKAMAKLTLAADDLKSIKPQLRGPFEDFVRSLGNVDNVIDIGCLALENFLNKQIPTNVVKLYCMLHVSYAMSKCVSTDTEKIDDAQFATAAAEWKACLQVIDDKGVFEQELFDEIKKVMWEEFEVAMKFTSTLQERVDDGELNASIINWDDYVTFVCDNPSPHDTGDPVECKPANGAEDLSGDYDSMHLSSQVTEPGGGLDKNPLPFVLQEPPWDELINNLVIVTALEYLKSLWETGTMFLLICQSVCGSLLRTASNTPPASASPWLDYDQRQHILASLKKSLDLPECSFSAGIMAAVSSPFLTGKIPSLQDLENSIISLLKIHPTSSQSFKFFLTTVINHFNHYYKTKLPDVFKCDSDRYNSETYVCDRINEETNSPSSVESNAAENGNRKRGAEEMQDIISPERDKRQKLMNNTNQGPCGDGGLKFKFYNPNKVRRSRAISQTISTLKSQS